ncbi:MAG: BolA family protein [Myxococcota bacterium]
MSYHNTRMSPSETLLEIRTRVEAAIPGAKVNVQGGGGHYMIHVVSELFEGKRTLQRHRMVYSAIADLMKGDDAPVHAVDKLDTQVP